MATKHALRVTYGGKDYWIESSADPEPGVVSAQIGSALANGGGAVYFNHSYGAITIGLPGGPVSWEWVEEE